MNWQCRLYGHQWRHAGKYEVVLRDDSHPTYPFQCARCEVEMHLDSNGRWRSDVTTFDSEDAELTPEVEQKVEKEVDTGPEIDTS